MSTLAPPPPTVIGAGDIAAATDRHRTELVEVVRAAYLTHGAGDSANPHSSFLRFPHQERSRIISLPAYLGARSRSPATSGSPAFRTTHGTGSPARRPR
ncbi:hypothetical protein [Streptomyces sp. 8ZJF_21]|uniref:hypothetical protein n=1 Tax=Streptomyces sp. 8ZJF_21 TaxID=2903141 RepID=UPI001E428C06|nr:hypothetical protein [Streptomyces sp. 8ZJF_21]MCD9591187.1 hypothetical protein [Streptomyces sp. 8ZJF_21]